MSTRATIYHQEQIHIYDELLENAVYLEVSSANVEINVRLMNSNELLSESRKALRLLSEGAKVRAAQLLRADGTTVESTSTSNTVENDRPKACPPRHHEIYSDNPQWIFCPFCGERLSS